MSKTSYIFCIICGIIFGFLLFIYPASVFYITAILVVSYFLYKKIDDSERPFILSIFYFGLFSRLAFIIVTHILSTHYGIGPKSITFPGMEGGAILPDDMGIHQRALALASVIRGIKLPELQTKVLLKFNAYGWSFHIYILGFLYYLFGAVPLLGKCINALFGVLTGIIVYFTAKELFGRRTAKLACILTLFYPTLFLWSIANLKDTVLIFMVSCSALSYVLFRKAAKARYLLLLLFLFFVVDLYRPGIIFILLFALSVSFILGIRWNCKRVLATVMAGLALLVAFGLYGNWPASIKSKLNRISISQLILQQGGVVASGGSSAYKIYPDRFYYMEGFDKDKYKDTPPITREEFVVSLTKGLVSLIFRPFPWEIDNVQKVFFYPVSVIYGVLFIFFIIGSLIGLRYRARESAFLILLFVTLSVFLALTSGNTGTMVRHRDMTTPIYIILSSFGIVQLLSRIQYRKLQDTGRDDV